MTRHHRDTAQRTPTVPAGSVTSQQWNHQQAPTRAHPASDASVGLSLAERIDKCLHVMHAPDRGPWTCQEAATRIAATTGPVLTADYLDGLRSGQHKTLTAAQLDALAAFCHVPLSYFTGTPDEVEDVDSQIDLLQAMRRIKGAPFPCTRNGPIDARWRRGAIQLVNAIPAYAEQSPTAAPDSTSPPAPTASAPAPPAPTSPVPAPHEVMTRPRRRTLLQRLWTHR